MLVETWNCFVQFWLGFKDSLYGIIWILLLDQKIEQDKCDKQNASAAINKGFANGDLNGTKQRLGNRASGLMIIRVFKCSTLNGVAWLCIYSLNRLLLVSSALWRDSDKDDNPGSWHFVGVILFYIFSASFIFPLNIIIKAVTRLWFNDFLKKTHEPLYKQLKAFSRFFADLIYGAFIAFFFLLQAFAIKHIFIEEIAYIMYCVHLCLLYALYAFEYKWFFMGIAFNARLQFIHRNWLYFCGFGLPLFVAMYFSTLLFSILLPFFVVSAIQASAPRDKCAIDFKIFRPTTALSNFIFCKVFRFINQHVIR
ncbi:unnamed protein product [Clavelina lepadiformis]|uniref:Etoposide-induced protein 2.4-like protein n=1 Tax=Clavelina lepadiformis TaxID=159417 RepID=A0ABP0F8I1_CLALP